MDATATTNGVPLRTEAQVERALTGDPFTLGYRPSGASSAFWGSDGTRPNLQQFMLDVEAMMAHPRVLISLGYYKSGISMMKATVSKASSPEVADWAASELRAMGRPTWKEALMALLILTALVLWVFGAQWINPTTVILVVVSTMVLPGVIAWDDVIGNRSAWDTLLYFATLLTLAEGLDRVGVVSWVASEVSDDDTDGTDMELEPLGELVGAAKEGLLALSVGVGLGVLTEMLEEEVDEVVGPKGKWNRERAAVSRPAAAPSRPAWTRAEEAYIQALWPIHGQVESITERLSLGKIFYKTGELGKTELKARVDAGLATYRNAEERLQVLQPPPSLTASHQEYLAAVRLFQQSAIELSKMFGDGDDGHLLAAYPPSKEGTDKIREVGVKFWEDEFPPH